MYKIDNINELRLFNLFRNDKIRVAVYVGKEPINLSDKKIIKSHDALLIDNDNSILGMINNKIEHFRNTYQLNLFDDLNKIAVVDFEKEDDNYMDGKIDISYRDIVLINHYRKLCMYGIDKLNDDAINFVKSLTKLSYKDKLDLCIRFTLEPLTEANENDYKLYQDVITVIDSVYTYPNDKDELSFIYSHFTKTIKPGWYIHETSTDCLFDDFGTGFEDIRYLTPEDIAALLEDDKNRFNNY